MRYQIECKTGIKGLLNSNAIRDDVIGDYIIADTPDEALDIALQCICDMSVDNGFKAEIIDDKEVEVLRDDECGVIELYYDFVVYAVNEFGDRYKITE